MPSISRADRSAEVGIDDGVQRHSSTKNPSSSHKQTLAEMKDPIQIRPSKWRFLGLWVILPATVVVAAVGSWYSRATIDPRDYAARTKHVLSTTPLIDGHNDLPLLIREQLHNRLYDNRFTFEKGLLSHTDETKMRHGQLGGQFWSVFIPCNETDVTDNPNWHVRDTLEQVDIVHRLITEFQKILGFCDTAKCISKTFKAGKVASMIGIEGLHQIGNSLGAIRQFHELGVRYITLTHNCDNVFATSTNTVAAGNEDMGLTHFGHEAVREMNRLGTMVDLSHVSHKTMRDVLGISRAPVIFSHSGSFQVQAHPRHVPDDVLLRVKQNGGVVMVPFVNFFLNMKNPEMATIHDVVDHIMHIANVAGWNHVGVGSDFDGTPDMPIGLENVSKMPDLMALLMERGATDEQIGLLAGKNIVRVWEEVERMSKIIQSSGEKPCEETWAGRHWVPSSFRLPEMFK